MGELYVVATPIGNLSDISQRALDVLRSVDIVAAEDTRRTLGLLSHFGISVTVISNYKHNEQMRARQLVERIITENISVAVVSDAGTPCISDPGSLLVRLARENDIKVSVVPGASAVTAALSVSGFNFVRFAFWGFIPRTNKEKDVYFSSIKNSDCDTFVLFESPNRIAASLKDLAKNLPGCELMVINDITKFHEKTYWGDVTRVISAVEAFSNSNLGEYTIVVHMKQANERENEAGSASANVSVEALLVDEIVKHNFSMKDAAAALVSRGVASRNDAYKAMLNLKVHFSHIE